MTMRLCRDNGVVIERQGRRKKKELARGTMENSRAAAFPFPPFRLRCYLCALITMGRGILGAVWTICPSLQIHPLGTIVTSFCQPLFHGTNLVAVLYGKVFFKGGTTQFSTQNSLISVIISRCNSKKRGDANSLSCSFTSFLSLPRTPPRCPFVFPRGCLCPPAGGSSFLSRER